VKALVDRLASPRSFALGLLALQPLNVFDLVSTLWWLENGQATEANAVMAGAYAGGPAAFSAAKLALVSLGSALLWRLREQRAARVAFIPLALFYAFISGVHIGWAVGMALGILGPLAG